MMFYLKSYVNGRVKTIFFLIRIPIHIEGLRSCLAAQNAPALVAEVFNYRYPDTHFKLLRYRAQFNASDTKSGFAVYKCDCNCNFF